MKGAKQMKKFLDDKRAISDAVAVLLFIAMAVVIAAVAGAFALSKTPEGSAPVAQLAIKGMDDSIIIDHMGGDAINPADLKVVLYDVSTGASKGNVTAPKIDGDTEPANVFNGGDRIIIDKTDMSTLSEGQYTVRVVFIPLDQVIAENNVYVR